MISISELRKNALFSDIKIAELRRILPTLRKEYYPRSAVICKQGEPGACIYIILSGQVKLCIAENTHSETLAYLNAGDFFGESALLTNEPRTVTAEAVIDAEILLLTQSNFYDLVEHNPTIMHNIIRTVDKRLRRKTLGMFHQQPKPRQIISIYSPKKTPGKSLLAMNLAESLVRQTTQPVVVLDMTMGGANIPAILRMDSPATIGEEEITEEQIRTLLVQHPCGVYLAAISSTLLRAGRISREQIASTLSILKTLFHYVVINTATEISNNTFEALDLSDTVVLLSPLGEEPPTGMFDHQEIVTAYYAQPSARESEQKRTSAQDVLWVLRVSSSSERRFYEEGKLLRESAPGEELNRTIDRIARQIAELRIGLALGGMAARGLSHIGVLQVFEEHGIPIDMIAGSSTGAIVGALYGMGINASDLERLALKLKQHLPLVSLRDVNPFGSGLLRHRKVIALLSEYIPEHVTFDDLKIPLRMITMILDVGQELALHSGSLLKGIEASLAIPGIFAPVKYDEKFLVDGSTINPVPISDLIEMDADILVGVNSFASLTPSYTPPPKAYESLVGYAENLKMIDIIIRSFQNLQNEISSAKSMIADVTICPDVMGYTWNDFRKIEGLIEAGRNAAEQMLPELQSVIENRRQFKKI